VIDTAVQQHSAVPLAPAVVGRARPKRGRSCRPACHSGRIGSRWVGC